MKYLFDIGNSRLKWAWANDEHVFYGGSCAHSAGIETLIGQIKRTGDADMTPDELLVCCIDNQPQVHATALRAAFGIEPVFAQVRKTLSGLTIAYADSEALGVDRWLGMLAAWKERQGPICVVDCGSACTIDLVDEHGQHLGGYIIPGMTMMRNALSRDAAQLPPLSGQSETAALTPGQDTIACMNNGVLLATTALIDAGIRHARECFGRMPDCLLTGGDASRIANRLCQPVDDEPLLLFRGLRLITAEVAHESEASQ